MSIAGAQTGTGKTAAFTLPMLQRLKPHASTSVSPARHPVRALIITPTRELAAQVFESVRTYGKYIPLRAACVFGGVNIDPQMAELRAGVEILVATPGASARPRASAHGESRRRCEILVLDEADRMLDMGFMPDIKRIICAAAGGAAEPDVLRDFPDDIKRLADQMLKDPVRIQVERRNTVTELVTHSAFKVDPLRKREFLEYLMRTRDMRQVLVFTSTKIMANRLARASSATVSTAPALHSDRPSRSAWQRWPLSRTARSRCWWPPTSRPAAWTSSRCRMSSTSSCRPTPRTTSTASAAPAAPALRARRSRWWRPTSSNRSPASSA